jgi:hypothetical protein
MDTQTKQPEPAMVAEPQKEHRGLQQLIGEWRYEATMVPDKPEEACTGIERVRTLGGLWILAEGQGEMPGGGTATTLVTLGYDPQRKRYVGTWVGSMMTHMWLYDGELESTGKILTLDTEGPDMSPGAPPGKRMKYRDVIEIKRADQRILTSHLLGDDGVWQQFMAAHYRRTK